MYGVAMTKRQHQGSPPPDAVQLREWTVDDDGIGRPFFGTRRGDVAIVGYQHADGTVERSIVLTGGEYDAASAETTARNLRTAAAEIKGNEHDK